MLDIDSNLNNINSIFFDIGDTLIDATSIAKNSLLTTIATLVSENVINDKSIFLESYIKADNEIQGPSVNHLFSNFEIAKKAFEYSGCKFSLKHIEMFLAQYRIAVRKKIQRNPALIRTVSYLKNKDIAIGIISDGTTIEQTEQLHRLGILNLIDVCITSEALDVEKPNQMMFLDALDEIKCENPSESIMVGNDLYRDIYGAKCVGMRTCLITKYRVVKRQGLNIFPDLSLETVHNLTKFLR